MRRGRTLIFVFLILIIGLVVAFVAFRQFLIPAEPVEPLTVEIYYAIQNIPQGGEIKPELLATMKIPPENLVGVMFTIDEQAALLNKVAKFPIDQGVLITESMVSDGSAAVSIPGPIWASLIPTGMTAITIPTDLLGLDLVGFGVNDGAHVNINACFKFVDIDPAFQTILPNLTAALTGTGFAAEGEGAALPVLSLGVGAGGSAQGRLELDPSLQQPYYLLPSEAQRPRMVCQMLLQDVLVLHAGEFPSDPAANLTASVAAPAPAPDPAADQTQQAPPVRPLMVTLIVSPQDSVTISYLIQTNAKLSLTLRNPTDLLRQATEASTLQFLLSQYNIPVPAKLPYSLSTDFISGGDTAQP